MKNNKLRIWLNVIIFLITFVVNFLATNLPLNGLTTCDISDTFDVYFVPADYVFFIWFVIYLALIGFVIYQALPKQRDNTKLTAISPWFLVSNIANALWLVSFHYLRFMLSLVFMVILLISLLVIFLKLNIGKSGASGAMKWLVELPFAIYLGWITVATIANVTQVLFTLGWEGFGIAPQFWLVVMLAVAVIISALMSFTRHNLPYAAVLVWSFVGIAQKFPKVPLVNTASLAATALVVVFLLAAFVRKKKAKEIK